MPLLKCMRLQEGGCIMPAKQPYIRFMPSIDRHVTDEFPPNYLEKSLVPKRKV